MEFLMIFCILVVGVSTVSGVCLYPPIHYLMSACSVRNLTVTDVHGNLMSNDQTCDNNLSKWSYQIDAPFVMNFASQPHRDYKNSTFLITVVDRTAGRLLWMVANVTAIGTALTPLKSYTRSVTIKPYQPPIFDTGHREHQIEYLVFQQKSSFPYPYSQIVQPNTYSFYLPAWLDSQSRRGVTFCGPVAGALIRINDGIFVYPTQPTWHPGPGSTKSPQRNAAPQFSSGLRWTLLVAGTLSYLFL